MRGAAGLLEDPDPWTWPLTLVRTSPDAEPPSQHNCGTPWWRPLQTLISAWAVADLTPAHPKSTSAACLLAASCLLGCCCGRAASSWLPVCAPGFYG